MSQQRHRNPATVEVQGRKGKQLNEFSNKIINVNIKCPQWASNSGIRDQGRITRPQEPVIEMLSK